MKMIDEKKIDHLEAMSNEELDKVVGGTCYEMADDSRFLNSLNGSTDRYSAKMLFGNKKEEIANAIANAWAGFGITVDQRKNMFHDNKYYFNGKEISQEQARKYAMKITGHFMTESDWKW